ASRTAIMRDGRFVQTGTPEEIVMEPADDYVLEFTREVDRSRVLTFRTIMEEAETVPEGMPAGKIRAMLQSRPDASTVFVTCSAGKPQGVIRRPAVNAAGEEQSAGQIMTSNFLKIRASKYIHNAFEAIRNANTIAVTDKTGRLVGTVDPIAVFSHLRSPLKPEAEKTNGQARELS
ncbi:MAG: CBS domain-containing protein, partial [Rhodomicrobium sp.]|nr:CBS domain-containing protein [Rhodomicrobium sp.]